MSLKKFKVLPVHVVEDHNDALEFIYKCLGSRYLPLEGNAIIHFDSHPDLMIPKGMPVEKVRNKYELFEALSIENWLMPACYARHFTSVYWIKPFWSEQIPIGSYSLTIGKYQNEIRLHSDIYYFVSDGVCVAKNQLENSTEILLKVSQMTDLECLQKFDFKKRYILDIDLDFFSTKNPFQEMFGKGGLYEKLKPLFWFDVPGNLTLNTTESGEIRDTDLIQKISDERAKQLEELDRIFSCLERHGSLEMIEKDLSKNTLQLVKDITDCVKEFYSEVDWSIVHSAGLTCDATELPHHVSNENELSEIFKQFEEFLKALEFPPVAVTIARSSEDDYCPSEQVDFIQSSVLKIVEKVFGEISLRLNYQVENTI